jgi:L-alanine-DL-glutamate epimerase-like enolase superfamily enzyme
MRLIRAGFTCADDRYKESMTDMKIERIEAIPYEIPYVKPLKFASGEVITADHVLLRIHTDTGIIGQADIPPRPYTYGETQASIVAVINSIFAPALIGLDPFRRQAVQQVLRRTVHNNTAKGGIDIALWDIIGQATGNSVWSLLGGFASSMRVSHMLGFKEPEVLLEEAQRFGSDYGVTTFKLKVGRHPIALDIEACRVLREGLGEDVELYLDANRGWTANEALEVLRRTEGLGLSFLEEPCDAKEAMGRRRLVEQSAIPIVGDESVPTAGDVSRELLSGGCNAICIKTARSGFTEAQEILGLSTGLGVDVYMGNQIDTQIGTIATIVFGAAHEATSRRAGELSNFLDMADDLLADPLVIREGRINVPEGPGVGARIDEEKLAFYRVDGAPKS